MFSKLLQPKEKSFNQETKEYVSYKNDDAIRKIENEFENYGEIPEDVDVQFAQKFTENNGKFIYCEKYEDILLNLIKFLSVNDLFPIYVADRDVLEFLNSHKEEYPIEIERNIEFSKVSLSMCEYGVANEGILVLNTIQNRLRNVQSYPKIQIFLLFKDQLRANINQSVYDYTKKHNSIRPFLLHTKETKQDEVRYINNTLTLNAVPAEHLFVFYCSEELK